jgi:hypothetical protein
MISEWKTCLLDHAGEWGLPQTGEWSFLFFNNYHPHCSNMDVLWFWNAEKHPRVVTKISREPARPRREFTNLQQAYAAAPEWVPRPLHFGAQGNFWTLWMQGVPGMRFKRRHTAGVMRSMVETVARLHAATGLPSGNVQPDRYRRSVTEPLHALREFGSSPAVEEGCRRLFAKTGADWIGLLPVISQHGDLYDGNLLEHNGGWHVVDWESYGMVDLPAYDLYTLLLSMLLVDGATCREWRSGLTDKIPGLTGLYGERLGLSRRDLALLLPLTLANWFYVQWKDGRAEFSERFYPTIADYFENSDRWENIFLSRANQ